MRQKSLLELGSSLAILAVILFFMSPQAFGDLSVNVDESDRIETKSQLTSPAEISQSFVYILQVLDSSGYAVFLDWKVGIIAVDGQTVQIGWSPEKRGSYTLQTFLWTDLESPAPLDILDKTEVNLNDKNIATCSGSANCFNGIVTRVIDGDTIRTNDNVTIRFALVNTPERGELGYLEATDFTSRMCPVGSEVLVDEDDGQTEGSYGRMIAKVYCADGKPINEELLKEGHATLYRDFCDVSEFVVEDWAQEYGCSEEQPDTAPSQLSLGELKQHALKQINEDRKEYGLLPVSLSDNPAAQVHAEDVFRTKQISHWMTNGEKPYMTYSRYDGIGDVAQNVAVSGDVEYYQKCVSRVYLCGIIDPFEAIQNYEYAMMYEDLECCDNGHRDNILDKYHTHVSIGIAYDAYSFVLVQNFENQYITWTDRINEDNPRDDTVTMAGSIDRNKDGSLSNNMKMERLEIYYDETPTGETYEDNTDTKSYASGELVGVVVEPLRPGWFYEQPDNYTIFEAGEWRVYDREFEIEFSLDELISQHGDGVYTVTVWCKDENDDVFVVSSSSLFIED